MLAFWVKRSNYAYTKFFKIQNDKYFLSQNKIFLKEANTYVVNKLQNSIWTLGKMSCRAPKFFFFRFSLTNGCFATLPSTDQSDCCDKLLKSCTVHYVLFPFLNVNFKSKSCCPCTFKILRNRLTRLRQHQVCRRRPTYILTFNFSAPINANYAYDQFQGKPIAK